VTAGFYAPLPPARTGIADYAAALLTAMRRHGRIDIAPEQCDAALYHLGNNEQHSEIYRRALERPGVVVLHDAVLHHYLLGQLDAGEYVEEFVYNYGSWNRGLAEELWHSRAASGTDSRYFQYPMLKRIAERARAIVVHNPGAARIVTAHAPHTRVIEGTGCGSGGRIPAATRIWERPICLWSLWLPPRDEAADPYSGDVRRHSQ
jgi:hypothetical protein